MALTSILNYQACGRPNASKLYRIFNLRLCKHTCGNVLYVSNFWRTSVKLMHFLRLLSSDGYLDAHHMVSSEIGRTEYQYLASATADASR